jgi:predicted Zn-dependent peptidase
VTGTPTPGKSLSDLEAAIDAEIQKVKTGKIEDWELEKARIAARRNYVASLGSSLSRAISMSQNAMFYNDPDLLSKRQERIEKVTAADVQRVASQYLVKENRTVVTSTPKPSAGRGGN